MKTQANRWETDKNQRNTQENQRKYNNIKGTHKKHGTNARSMMEMLYAMILKTVQAPMAQWHARFLQAQRCE